MVDLSPGSGISCDSSLPALQIHESSFPEQAGKGLSSPCKANRAAKKRRRSRITEITLLSGLTRRLVVYSHLDCLRLLDLSGSLFNFMLLIFQEPKRTNVLLISIVSGRGGDFNSLFRKIRHHFLWSLMNFRVGKRPDRRSPYSLFMRRRFWGSYPR